MDGAAVGGDAGGGAGVITWGLLAVSGVVAMAMAWAIGACWQRVW